jgi:predicted Zn-ribbon and HTH transcriptional regulator
MAIQQHERQQERRETVDPPQRQFRCIGCGYGASRPVAPERCPMCAGSVWGLEPGRPFDASDSSDPISRAR